MDEFNDDEDICPEGWELFYGMAFPCEADQMYDFDFGDLYDGCSYYDE